MRSITLLAVLTASLLTCSANADHIDATKTPEVRITDLGQGLFELRTDQSGNVVVLVGEDGVFMVDTQMEHLAQSVDEAQKTVSGGQIVSLILNTHLHRDHVRGNAYFAGQGAQIMAHPNVRKFLEDARAIRSLGRTAPETGPEYLPSINIGSGTLIMMNGQTARLYHTPAAHTDGDIFIHFEEANVIHAGDLLYSGRFPFIDIDNGGTVDGYIAGMQAILEVANDKTVIVAGHGPTSSEKEVEASILMLTRTRAIIRNLVERGLTLAEIAALDPLADYRPAWDWEFIDADSMTRVLYYDLTGRLE